MLFTTAEVLSLEADAAVRREELGEEEEEEEEEVDEELDEPEDAATGVLVPARAAAAAALAVDVDVQLTADEAGEKETFGKADDDASFDLTTVDR